MLYLLILSLLHVVCGFIISSGAFKPQNRTEHVLQTGLVAYVTFYIVPLVSGWTTGYMNGYMLAMGTVAAIAGTGAVFRWFRPDVSMWRFTVFSSRPWGEWLIWAVGAVVLLFILLSGLALPARIYDAPAYHMSNPVRWHQSGRFILDSFGAVELSPQLYSAESAPNVKAIWPYAVLLFTSDTPGTAAAQFPFLLILLATVRAIGLRLGISGWLASLAMVFCLAIPEIFLQSLEAYADLIFLSGEMVLVWSLLYLWQTPFSWRSITFPALGFAVLFGAKAAAIASGGVLGLLYGILLIWKGTREAKWMTPAWIGLALILTLGAIAFSGGPWFFHAWNKFSNPVFPFTLKLGQKVVFTGHYDVDVNSVMLKQLTGTNGAEAYWNTLRELWRVPGLSNWAGGLGAITFIAGIPALILYLLATIIPGHTSGSRRIFAVCFIVLTAATPTLGISRFTLFQAVMAMVAFAWLALVIPIFLRIIACTIAIAAAFYGLYMTAPSIQFHKRPPALLAFHLLTGFPRAAQVDSYPDQYTSLDFWREEVSAPGKRLAVHGTNVAVWNAYSPWSPADVLRVRDPLNDRDLDLWHDELVQSAVTHLYVQRGQPAWDVVFGQPEKFKLLIRQADSHWSARNDGFQLSPQPEDALFAVVTEKSNG